MARGAGRAQRDGDACEPPRHPSCCGRSSGAPARQNEPWCHLPPGHSSAARLPAPDPRLWTPAGSQGTANVPANVPALRNLLGRALSSTGSPKFSSQPEHREQLKGCSLPCSTEDGHRQVSCAHLFPCAGATDTFAKGCSSKIILN